MALEHQSSASCVNSQTPPKPAEMQPEGDVESGEEAALAVEVKRRKAATKRKSRVRRAPNQPASSCSGVYQSSLEDLAMLPKELVAPAPHPWRRHGTKPAMSTKASWVGMILALPAIWASSRPWARGRCFRCQLQSSRRHRRLCRLRFGQRVEQDRCRHWQPDNTTFETHDLLTLPTL